MEMISQVTMPGAFIADIIPICKKKVTNFADHKLTRSRSFFFFLKVKHVPSWVPFLSCKKDAQRGRAMAERLVQTPFNHVVHELVSVSIKCLDYLK